MINDVEVILKVYFISLGLQFLVWPWVSKWFRGLADNGWALGRVLGLLTVGLPIWFVGHVFPVNTDLGVAIVILLMVLAGFRAVQVYKTAKIKPLKIILIEECLFAAGLFGLSLVRGFQPDILGLEKFMDFGFIKQYLTSNELPAKDMWLAGESINYYSFGHFIASILVRIWGVGLGVGYNLILAWILGVSLTLSFSIIVSLRGGVIGGLLGALLTCLGGNSHVLWYFLKNKGFESYWYADATRFIENTIHEFPGYSFVVSDLHAHVLGLPVVLAFILVLVLIFKKLPQLHLKEVFVLGVLLGVMGMTNTWDVAVYGLLLVIFGLFSLFYGKINWRKLLVAIGVVGMTAGITAVPWFLNFNSFSGGALWVKARSPLWQLGVLWGGHVAIVVLAMVVALKSHLGIVPSRGNAASATQPRGRNFLILALGVTAMLLLIIPEMVYVEDIYTGYPRANTMFKLTYQSFILMSLVMGWMVNEVLRKRKRLFLIGVVILWGGLMIFPFKAYPSYYRDFKEYQGLDGLEWMRVEEKDKWGAVVYLTDNEDGKNLLEAVGDSYSRFNSVSAFSGTNSVLGWRVHEWLWRGGYERVKERELEVKTVFEKGKEEKSREIIRKYDVGWIYIGKEERENYEVDEEKLLQMGEVVLDSSLSEIEWQGEIVVVGKGESLWSIADEVRGGGYHWKELVELNKEKYSSLKENPEYIQTGWVLRVDEEGVLDTNNQAKELWKDKGSVLIKLNY